MFAQPDADALSSESPGWKALEAIGCRPTFIRNALASHGEEWALDVAEESRGANSPPALAKWFDKTNTQPAKRRPKPAAPEAPQDTAAAAQREADERKRTARTTAAVNALSVEQRLAFYASYPGADKAKGPFLAETGHFKSKLDDVAFTSFLREQVRAAEAH
jgi:hypothetical protein